MTVRSISLALAAAGTALFLSACSGGGAQQSPSAFTGSGDCASQKAEMGRLASQGVEGEIAASSSGKKLSPEAQGRVDRYNDLLNSYLSNGCHSS